MTSDLLTSSKVAYLKKSWRLLQFLNTSKYDPYKLPRSPLACPLPQELLSRFALHLPVPAEPTLPKREPPSTRAPPQPITMTIIPRGYCYLMINLIVFTCLLLYRSYLYLLSLTFKLAIQASTNAVTPWAGRGVFATETKSASLPSIHDKLLTSLSHGC